MARAPSIRDEINLMVRDHFPGSRITYVEIGVDRSPPPQGTYAIPLAR